MILAAKGLGGGIPKADFKVGWVDGDVEALISDIAFGPLGGGAAAVEPIGGGDGDPVEELVGRGTPALALSPLGRRAGRRRGFFDF